MTYFLPAFLSFNPALHAEVAPRFSRPSEIDPRTNCRYCEAQPNCQLEDIDEEAARSSSDIEGFSHCSRAWCSDIRNMGTGITQQDKQQHELDDPSDCGNLNSFV